MSAVDKTAAQRNKRKDVIGQSECNYNHFPSSQQPCSNLEKNAKVAKKELRGMPPQISLRHLVNSCGFPSKTTTVKGVYHHYFHTAISMPGQRG